MNNQYPKIALSESDKTTFQVNLGSFTRSSTFEMFLHPAKKTELTPIRRTDYTNWSSNLDGSIKALAQHNVECNKNEVLDHWTVISESRSKKMQIAYSCVSFLSVGTVTEKKYTKWNYFAENENISLGYLDRHTLLCDSDEAIGAFQMELSGKYIRFGYRCNKVVSSPCRGPKPWPKTMASKQEQASKVQSKVLRTYMVKPVTTIT